MAIAAGHAGWPTGATTASMLVQYRHRWAFTGTRSRQYGHARSAGPAGSGGCRLARASPNDLTTANRFVAVLTSLDEAFRLLTLADRPEG